MSVGPLVYWCFFSVQHNDIQHKHTHHNDIKHYNIKKAILSIMTISMMEERRYTMSFMLSVDYIEVTY